ncbi:MAG: hypothetical protein HRU70_02875 [Phycisphaeraceae bacterium]|nr:MAG: hypothetical protein HRU70_02875 [Phycisphaeraceae bacterium]
MTPGTRQLAEPSLLFTAFEPSGDEHASIIIAELRRRHPTLPIHAWGGPRMERAGATLVERTGDDAVIGIPGLKKIREHLRTMARINRWLKKNPATVLVPVDSPGANDPICDLAKAQGLRVVHLVAPQIWAWGRWRIKRLRRRTDLLLCLFDFEVRFFGKRDVPARYIGHPIFDVPLDLPVLDREAQGFPSGRPRLAMFPGSRPDEIVKHFPLLMDVFRDLKARHAEAVAVVAATGPATERLIRDLAARHGGWPEGMRVEAGKADAIIRWCDLCLVKSGTITLQIARQIKPMVVFYRKGNPLLFLLAKTILATKVFSLPNVLARRRIVPELVPHFGGADAIVRAADALLRSPEAMERQRNDLRQVVAPFMAGRAASRAADAIEEVAGIRREATTAA